jgi:hypothetical protein
MVVITLSESTASALSNIGLGDFSECETAERMAFVVLVLKGLKDLPEHFPKGKWATIQHIESGIEQEVNVRISQLDET